MKTRKTLFLLSLITTEMGAIHYNFLFFCPLKKIPGASQEAEMIALMVKGVNSALLLGGMKRRI